MSEAIEREKESFNEALELASSEARAGFLKDACGGDSNLREKLEALLAAYDAAEGFIPAKNLERTALVNVPLSGGPGRVIGRFAARNYGEGCDALSKVLMGDLDCIAMKCLEKGRTRRYETARGLAAQPGDRYGRNCRGKGFNRGVGFCWNGAATSQGRRGYRLSCADE